MSPYHHCFPLLAGRHPAHTLDLRKPRRQFTLTQPQPCFSSCERLASERSGIGSCSRDAPVALPQPWPSAPLLQHPLRDALRHVSVCTLLFGYPKSGGVPLFVFLLLDLDDVAVCLHYDMHLAQPSRHCLLFMALSRATAYGWIYFFNLRFSLCTMDIMWLCALACAACMDVPLLSPHSPRPRPYT